MYIIGNEKKNRQRINYWTLTWNYLDSNPPQENNKEIGVSQSWQIWTTYWTAS